MGIATGNLLGLIQSWGANLAGVGDLSVGFDRASLCDEFRHFSRVISIAARCAKPDSPNWIDQEESVHHQQMIEYLDKNNDAIATLNHIIKKTSKLIKISGYRYFALPPIHTADERKFSSVLYQRFTHRQGATCAGLGWIGKSGMLINQDHGPNLVWATILTNAPLEPSRPLTVSQCGDCSLCQSICPAQAIKGVIWQRSDAKAEILNIKACGDYMMSNAPKFGRPVCGICFMSCPTGRPAPKAALAAC
ncbi:MAG: epoxyqueuosine reductase [Nitrospinae bacterium]|nr:epoxyqueuosine reductase [Nitrospinota bacterium]